MLDKELLALPRMKKMLAILVGLAFFQAFLIIGQTYGLAVAIVNVWKGFKWTAQLKYLSVFVICFLLRQLLINFRAKLLENYADEQTERLRKEVLAKIFSEGSALTSKLGSGNVVTSVLNGMDQVNQYIQLILSKMLNMMIIPFVIDIYVFYLDWISGLILLLVFPVIIIFMVILGKVAKSRADKQYNKYQQLANHFTDSLRGLSTLKYLGISKKYAKSIYQTSEEFRKATISALKIGMLSSFALDFFATLSIAVVAVFLGVRLIDERITFLPALIVLILSPEYFLPIRMYASDYHATLNGKNAFYMMLNILRQPKRQSNNLTIKTWNNHSTLALQNIDLNYQEKKGLADISFQVQGKKKIGIIGLSGAGKTTLLQVLSGFLTPSAGQIKIDGVATDTLNIPDYQSQIAYITQKPYLFHASLRQNIIFYHPTASDEEIQRAIKLSGLTEVVASLPEGLDTMIGEGERQFSGGQAQRIALARILLDEKRQILFFDEPTAHLDIETEMELKQSILPFMENKLVFFATHRLHWMKQMDEIIVIQDGQIVEHGTYHELLQQKGPFQKFVE